jgi:hypothetical protein
VSIHFIINLHAKDLPLLYKIHTFFGVGRIYVTSDEKVASFTVSKLSDIINVIIPHFKDYPLQSCKSIDLQLWTQCAKMMANKEHLSELGLNKIISLKSVINLGISKNLKLKFEGVKLMERPEYIVNENHLNPN